MSSMGGGTSASDLLFGVVDLISKPEEFKKHIVSLQKQEKATSEANAALLKTQRDAIDYKTAAEAALKEANAHRAKAQALHDSIAGPLAAKEADLSARQDVIEHSEADLAKRQAEHQRQLKATLEHLERRERDIAAAESDLAKANANVRALRNELESKLDKIRDLAN